MTPQRLQFKNETQRPSAEAKLKGLRSFVTH